MPTCVRESRRSDNLYHAHEKHQSLLRKKSLLRVPVEDIQVPYQLQIYMDDQGSLETPI